MYDLHIHSEYSDGNAKIEEIIKRAKEKGLKAIAIADHSIEHRLGLTESKARKRQAEIERFSSKYDIEVLSAIECGILPDGEIALPEFRFDLILVSIHTQLHPAEYYDRIMKCIKKHQVDVLAHLHSELFGSVSEIPELDLEIVDLIEENEIALEINSHHMAPPDNFLEMCRGKKIKYSVGSDSHILNEIGKTEIAWKKAKLYLNKGKFILGE